MFNNYYSKMHDKYNIDSILNAINEINIKSKKTNVTVVQNSIPKLNQDLKIPLDLDRLIQEAEKHKKKTAFKFSQVEPQKNDSTILKLKNYNKTLEETQAKIIDELYSKFTKKVKKNTLKTIFNLLLKVKDLEKKLEDNLIKKEQLRNNLVLKNESVESLKIHDPIITTLNKVTSLDENVFSKKVVTPPIMQDSTISILNEKINISKKTETTLRFEITSLTQDKTLLLNKLKNFDETKIDKNYINDVKKHLKFIYKQVEKQKEIFINLKNHSTKLERYVEFFKENYEKSIVENKEIKKRLEIAKEQIVVYESNKLDLLSSIHQLNEILSKTNIATNISPLKKSPKDNTPSREKKSENTE